MENGKKRCEEKKYEGRHRMSHATRVWIATAVVHQTARRFEGEFFFVIMAVKDTARRVMKLKNDEERHAMEVLHQVALTLACQFYGELSTSPHPHP
jgi:hypothetical protein